MFKELSVRLGALGYGSHSVSPIKIDDDVEIATLVDKYGMYHIEREIERGRLECIPMGKFIRCFEFRRVIGEQFEQNTPKDTMEIWKDIIPSNYWGIIRGETYVTSSVRHKKKRLVTSITNSHMTNFSQFDYLENIETNNSAKYMPTIHMDVTTSFIDAHNALMKKVCRLLLPGFTSRVLDMILEVAEYSCYFIFNELETYKYDMKYVRMAIYKLLKMGFISDSNIRNTGREKKYQTQFGIISCYSVSITFYRVVHAWLDYKPKPKKSGFICPTCMESDNWHLVGEDIKCSVCDVLFEHVEPAKVHDSSVFRDFIWPTLENVHDELKSMIYSYINSNKYTRVKERVRYPQWERKYTKRGATHVEYIDDGSNTFGISFQHDFFPRKFQVDILKMVFSTGGISNSILDVPCGAGKTAMGIALTVTVQRPTIIFVTTNESRNQWLKELQRFTSIPSNYIYIAGEKEPYESPKVIISTYCHMYRYMEGHEEVCNGSLDISKLDIFMAIYDEVQCMTSDKNRLIPSIIRSKVNIGLTGTLMKVAELCGILGGATVYSIAMKNLVERGYICPVYCTLVIVPLSTNMTIPECGTERNNVCNNNIAKIDCTLSIVRAILRKNKKSKILIYIENIRMLKVFAKECNKIVYICGDTLSEERSTVFEKFSTEDSINVLCVSSIGDTSINLPSCDVVINMSRSYGSFVQTGQRVGRANRISDGKNFGLYYHLVTDYHTDLVFGREDMNYLKSIGYDTCEFSYTGYIADRDVDTTSSQNVKVSQKRKKID